MIRTWKYPLFPCLPPVPSSRSPCSSQTASVTPSPTLSRRSDSARLRPSPSSTLHRQHLNRARLPLVQESPSSDTDGSCYTELYPGLQSYVERLQVEESSTGIAPLREEDGNVYFSPVVEAVSRFKPSRYQSPLMPSENKPLEVCILRRVKELLAEVDPRTAAKHITKGDCTVLLKAATLTVVAKKSDFNVFSELFRALNQLCHTCSAPNKN